MAEIRLKSTGTIKLFENDNTSSVTNASPASLGADRTVTLPDADVTLVSGTMSTGFAVTDITGQTALGATPADTDEFVLSDAGVLKRVDYSYLKTSNTPAFSSYLANNTSQAISDGVLTKVTLNTEWFDSDSTFDNSTNYRFTCPAGGAGQYLFCWQIFLYAANTSSNIEYVNTKLYKNGSAFIGTDNDYRDNEPRSVVIGNSVILDIADADYFELYGLVKQNSGSPSFYGGDRQTYFSGMRLST